MKQLQKRLYVILDRIYIAQDRAIIETTRNLRLIPDRRNRTGGKLSYGEWAYVVGIFQTILYFHLNKKQENRLVDVGCGTGLLGIAAEPFVVGNGEYIGIDVRRKNIDFCRNHFPSRNFTFQHLESSNPTYTNGLELDKKKWHVGDESIDAVTALSVWTHMNEDDAVFYFREIDRILKPSGVAIITFFLLDEGSPRPSNAEANGLRFHNRTSQKYVFDVACRKSGNWRHPKWVERPEDAIGVTRDGLNILLQGTGLRLLKKYPGTWRDTPGVFFQDILVFQKSTARS